MDGRRNWARIVASVFLFAISIASLRSYVADESGPGRGSLLTVPLDFVAFYCGGKVLAERRDPYSAEPLRTCEDGAFEESRIGMIPNLVIPAPFPPYALAAFAPLSFASFRFAAVLYFSCSLLAIAVAVVLVWRLTRISPIVIGVALLVAFSLGSIVVGQLVPFLVVALCASALALRSGRVYVAAAIGLLAMIEPQLGLPALVGAFVLVPRARAPIALGMLALALTSLAAGGGALNLEYLTRVLPAHARSEVANFHAQYSLTSLAYAAGASADVALRLGEASYVAMTCVGVWLAARLYRAHGDAAFAILTPPACALVGGVYVHDHQMAAALPFAFAVARYARRRTLVLAATMLLAVPWQSVFDLFLSPLFPSHVRIDPGPALATLASGSNLAETVWTAWIAVLAGRDGRTPLEISFFRLPTWFALVAIGIAATRATYESSPARLRSAIRR